MKGEKKMRIKCPNCGSTAQVVLTYSDTNSYTDKRVDEYVCGCGCHFTATFKLVEITNCGIEK
jgi:hypothetical protein